MKFNERFENEEENATIFQVLRYTKVKNFPYQIENIRSQVNK